MRASPGLVNRWRQSVIDMIGDGGSLALYSSALDVSGNPPAGGLVLRIVLSSPAGVVDSSGVVISDTEYAQIVSGGSVVAARAENSAGQWVADFTAGLNTDIPTPELILPQSIFRAGAFVRLSGSRIDISQPPI